MGAHPVLGAPVQSAAVAAVLLVSLKVLLRVSDPTINFEQGAPTVV